MQIKKRFKEMKQLKKKQIIIITIILFLILISLSTIIIVKYCDIKRTREREQLISSIKKSYNKYIITNKKAVLYNKKLQKIGYIEKGIDLEIVKNKNSSFKYYKIKNTDYYIHYKNVNKIKELTSNNQYSNYLNLNKNVITKNNIKLYLDGNVAMTINQSLNIPIKFINEDNYYVNYLNKLFMIKKDNVKSVVDKENNTDEETNYISIINYNVLAEKCNKEDCVNIKNIEEQIDYLNKNGYYSITISEYKNWLNGNIRLKPRAIVLTTPNETNEVKIINEKYSNILNVIISNNDIKFVEDNNKTTKDSKIDNLSRYNVKLNTTLDTFQRMALGDNVPIASISNNNVSKGGQKIAVLNYHFFYDENSGQFCGENICEPMGEFRKHLDYLRDNGFKTLTIKEFKDWMYGEIELPTKSVLITVDDGAFGTGKHNGNNLIPILEEYNMHATLFLITGWWDINNYRSPNLDIQSHTNDMHNSGSCGKAQAICANHDELIQDFQKSISIIGDNTSFCFPFYSYDEESINAVKEVGFKISFIGGNRKASRNDDKYKIPRYPIYKTTSMDGFISMVN